MNLCFAYPNKFRFSETFIRDQIDQLKPAITIYEGWYPSLNQSDKSFLPFPLSILLIRGGLRNILPKLYHRIYTYFLKRYLLKNNIDVVLAQYGPMGTTLLDACKEAGIALVVHFHGFDANEEKTLGTFLDAYKNMFQYVGGIIAVSNDMREKLIEFGASPNQVVFNSCFVDTKKFTTINASENEKIFVAVGRFTAKKSPLLTIKAFSRVVAKYADAKLIMIGEGELFEQAKELIIELKIEPNVILKGAQHSSEVITCLRKARVFVQHSMFAPNGDSEGTPVSILEASATGLPIVSTTHAGIKDAVVHDKTGFLVNEGDWELMADYMIQLAENPILAGQMGQAAREHIEEFYSMDKRVNTLKQVLSTAIAINKIQP